MLIVINLSSIKEKVKVLFSSLFLYFVPLVRVTSVQGLFCILPAFPLSGLFQNCPLPSFSLSNWLRLLLSHSLTSYLFLLPYIRLIVGPPFGTYDLSHCQSHPLS